MGCSSTQVREDPEMPPKRPVSEYVKEDVTYPIDANDPFEGLNRRIYRFNALFDEKVFLPVVKGYEFLLPNAAQKGVSHFFSNLNEVTNLLNTLLQGKVKGFGKTAGRVVINTTVGIAGFWDPATRMGIVRQNEDFGQTLGFYKVGSGPYLVLPLLGPSSLRDTGGLVVDTLVNITMIHALLDLGNMNTGDQDKIQGASLLLSVIDERHKESFRYYETGSPFEYELIRFLCLLRRKFLVEH
jgi:phospholipid-binding lipoprotein MlaA